MASEKQHTLPPESGHVNGVKEPQKQKKAGVTFAGQDKLPKLPVPDLKSSLDKYLESLKPLQTPREHRETEAAVADFLKNEGQELQERLKKYASNRTSYIEQFCASNSRLPMQTC